MLHSARATLRMAQVLNACILNAFFQNEVAKEIAESPRRRSRATRLILIVYLCILRVNELGLLR